MKAELFESWVKDPMLQLSMEGPLKAKKQCEAPWQHGMLLSPCFGALKWATRELPSTNPFEWKQVGDPGFSCMEGADLSSRSRQELLPRKISPALFDQFRSKLDKRSAELSPMIIWADLQ